MTLSSQKERGLKAFKTGYMAESIARFYLRLKGYKILSQNYKTSVGEIDIIAQHKKTIVFFEIKYRRNKGEAQQALSSKNQKRVMRAAEHYMVTSKTNTAYDMRFDFISLAPPFHLEHIKNAWMQ